MRPARNWIALAALAALAGPGAGAGGAPRAGLEWEMKVLTVKARAVDEVLHVAYHYRNTGPATVRVREIETSCGCTTARLARKVVPAGAEGEVDVRFEVRDRVGPVEETITVRTDGAAAPPTRLILRVAIPPRVEASARLVSWERHEVPAAKDILLTAADGIEFKFLEPKSPDPRFRVSTETLKPGRSYRLRIGPGSTEAPAQTTLALKVETTVGGPQTLSFIALVR